MKKFFVFLVLVAVGLFAAGEAGYINLPLISGKAVETAQRAFGRGRRPQQRVEEIPVLTALVRKQDVPITLDAVGTVQALNTVLVRAQVEGRLMEIAFRDGQEVKKGDVLARIDPRAYQAQYDQAVAKKAQDEAQLANARIDLERYRRLAASNFGSRQQADTQQAVVAQLEAQARVDQAMIDSARTVLDYTTIIAPIDGRTGLRAVDAGNIIRASDANGLVTITQMNPIAAVFNLPQQQLRAVNDAAARGALRAEALEADNTTVIETGEVEVVDNLVDVATGTVRVKARFPNAQRHLWPGQFVNVRLYVDVERQANVIPTGAVQRGPRGAYVYVVGEDRKVSLRNVTVGRQDERLAVIRTGIEPGLRVVTTGFSQLTDGATVKPSDPETPQPEAAAFPAPPAASGQRPERGGGRRGPTEGGAGAGTSQGQAQPQGQAPAQGQGQGRRQGGQGQRTGQAQPPATEGTAGPVTR
jgi:multidrug efflux system membrane fusion protein